MKYILYDQDAELNQKKIINRKKLIITIAIVVAIVVIIILSALYISNRGFREFFDQYIFQKSVKENSGSFIEVDAESNYFVYAYDKYISVLDKNVLNLYSSNGKKEHEIKVEINNPIFQSNGRYLVVAEKNKQKLYLISGQNIIWQKDLEGNISKVYVNKNGYTSVVLTGTTYKTIVTTFDPEGNKLFSTILSTTSVADIAISNDNKYLAIAEINSSGTLIQSNIKIVSFEKAQSAPYESIIFTYKAESDSLIVDIEYQDKNRLVCMYDNGIHVISEEKDEQIISFSNAKVIAADISLNEYCVQIVEKSTGLFTSSTNVELIQIGTQKQNLYVIDSSVKNIYCYNNVVAINLGSEVHFVDTNGWLVKKYTSSQEIKNIVICDNMAGIVYRDKIEIVNL